MDDDYPLYASSTPLRPGETIRPFQTLPAEKDVVYVLDPNENFIRSERREQGGYYFVQNSARDPRLFGLAQAWTVNARPSQTPLSAVMVPSNAFGTLEAEEDAVIFLSQRLTPGMILSGLPREQRPLGLRQNPVVNVALDDNLDFVPA